MPCRAYALGKSCTNTPEPGAAYCRLHAPVATGRLRTTTLGASDEAPRHYTTAQVADSGPVVVDSGSLAKPRAKSFRSCHGTTRAGLPCRFPPPAGEDFCVNHGPGSDPAAVARRASEAARVARIKANPSSGLLTAVLRFDDRTGIQATLDVATRLFVADRIDERKYRAIISACNAASRNFDRQGESLEGPKPQRHEEQRYWFSVRALLDTVDPLITAPSDGGASGDAA